MSQYVCKTCLNSLRIRIGEILLGDACVVLERSYCGYDNYEIRPDAQISALDIKELLSA